MPRGRRHAHHLHEPEERVPSTLLIRALQTQTQTHAVSNNLPNGNGPSSETYQYEEGMPAILEGGKDRYCLMPVSESNSCGSALPESDYHSHRSPAAAAAALAVIPTNSQAKNRVVYLVLGSLLLPLAILSLVLTCRDVVDSFRTLPPPVAVNRLPLQGLHFVTSCLSVVTASVSCHVALSMFAATPSRVLMLLSGMLDISITAVFFTKLLTEQSGDLSESSSISSYHFKSLQKFILLFLHCGRILCSVVILALTGRYFVWIILGTCCSQWRRNNFPRIPGELHSLEHGALNPVRKYLHRVALVMTSLLGVASIIAFLGFTVGVVVNVELQRMATVQGGGLHTGLLCSALCAMVWSTLAKRLTSPCIYTVGLFLTVASLISASVTFYTEEWECFQALEDTSMAQPTRRPGNSSFGPQLPPHPKNVGITHSTLMKYLLLTKVTLVLFSAIFHLSFLPVVLVTLCCLWKWHLAKEEVSKVWMGPCEYFYT